MTKIIKARNISKKYTICHEHGAYTTLVETLSKKAIACFRSIRHPFKKCSIAYEKQYEDFWALKNIDFDIEEGDRVGIIGRNGAGKSTLLKILSRITEPTTGNIEIRGRVASLLEVGTGFHPELTGRENIFLNGAILGMSKEVIKKRFDEIVAFADIEKFLDTPVKRFSSGMYTRLGFAIAAHMDSDLLIVDEVLAVGDMNFQEKCFKKMNDLSQCGRTILFVSHDIRSMLALCSKGIFLEGGRIVEQGPIDQCVNSYMCNNRLQKMVWEGNEGDEHVRFYKASLVTSEKREFFYQDEQALVEIEYKVLKPTPDLIFGIQVYNKHNQFLARAHTFDGCDQVLTACQQVGRNKATFSIDGKFFHEGEYLIKVDCFIHNRKKVLRGDEIMLKFPVYLRNKDSRFLSYITDGVALGNQWTVQSN